MKKKKQKEGKDRHSSFWIYGSYCLLNNSSTTTNNNITVNKNDMHIFLSSIFFCC